MAKTKKPRLGRGLSSLMAAPVTPPSSSAIAAQAPERATSASPEPDAQTTHPPVDSSPGAAVETPANLRGPDDHAAGDAAAAGLQWIPVGAIEPNPYQPRRAFNEEALGQLAESIRQDGVMQPIVVRRRPDAPRDSNGPVYQLVAGERRWRAVRIAGLGQIPALVQQLDDRKLAEWAVIENLQREDLNPIEQAEAFAGLVDRFGLSHQDVAERVGASRSAVTNTLRLLDLHQDVQELVRTGRLSPGHGRCLLGISGDAEQVSLAKRAAGEGWSVRATEQAVRGSGRAGGSASAPPRREGRPAHLADLEQQIAQQLQTKVKIKAGRRKNSGTLSIEFYDLDQFDGLLEKLGVRVE